jgi:putative ABC transport system permease protein
MLFVSVQFGLLNLVEALKLPEPMLNYFFKIAWRNMARHKMFTIINVAGLGLGVCACIVIFLVSSYELTFDNFHQDNDRIYHIGSKGALASRISSRVPPPMPAALRREIAGFEAVSGFYPYDATIIIPSRDGKTAERFTSDIGGSDQSSVIITDPHYFDIFKFDWLAGNPGASLNDPFKVVLSESKARKYFGSLSYNSIIGREVVYNDSLRVTVSGIVKDWNKNTDFPFTDLISYSSINSSSFLKTTYRTDAWGDVTGPGNPPIWAMVKLSKTVKVEEISRQLEAFIKRHIPADPRGQSKFLLEPLSDIHFNADYYDDVRKAHKPTLYILMGIALFILLLAVINFINLSTAQAIQRIREIGVRKVLGSSRVNLILHFLTETFIVSCFAVVMAVLMVRPVLSYFYDFIPTGVIFHLFSPGTLIFILIVTLVTSFLAGLYPAMVSSSHAPASSLKGDGGQRGGEKWLLRKGLIIFQFSISLIFIVGTFVIGRQVRNMLDTSHYGVKTDAILDVYTNRRDSISKLMVLVEKIRQVPGVEKVILEGSPPVGGGWGVAEISYMGKRPVKIKIRTYSGNEEFIPFYGMRLVAGRNLLRTDSLHELIINETCLKALGFTRPDDALGQFLLFQNKSLPIVGVVADFHEGSFHDFIEPLVIGHSPQNEKELGIQLASTRKQLVKPVLTTIEKLYYQIYPSNVSDWSASGFTYAILDEGIASYYETDQKTSRLVQAAMFVTIFISCMGLFGLAMFTARKRMKEISIRKVIGASAADIFRLLTRDFVALVLIAFLIASPLAWILMNKWLEGFAYRITVSWWTFVLAGASAVLIALLTVSFQAIKAASANPVKSLRSEF